jgi:lipopolysaccharide transport system permease protein
MVRSAMAHRQLLLQMTWRDVVGRYRGSLMGLAWSFLNPLVMLAIYTFVFSYIFSARWTGAAVETTSGFALVLFAGLIVHTLLAECLARAPGLILAHPNLVKRVVFPLEILPWTVMGSALFHAAVSVMVLLAAQWAVHGTVSPTVALLPVVLLPLVILTVGLSWLLAAIGVYVRDIGQVIGMAVTALLFLSPVFYPLSAVSSPRLRFWMQLNPMTAIIEDTRTVVLFGGMPMWGRLGAVMAASLVVAQIGFWFFQRSRKGFADVL